MSQTNDAMDLVEELRLRRWARENYVEHGERDESWHLVVHDEMSRRDRELRIDPPCRRSGIVPLMPSADELEFLHSASRR